MKYTDAAADVAHSVVCVSAVLSTQVSCCNNGWTDQDAVCGADSRIQLGLGSPWEVAFLRGKMPVHRNVPTTCECACPAHAVDERIHHHAGWQDGDAACCQITLDTCYYYYCKPSCRYAPRWLVPATGDINERGSRSSSTVMSSRCCWAWPT